MRGIVRGFSSDLTTVFVTHEEVDGVMPEMTMPFAADSASLASLRVGDAVSFVLRVRGGKSWITQIERVPLSAVTLATPMAVVDTLGGQLGAPVLAPGSPFPEIVLLDQRGEPFAMPPDGYAAVVVDYIYTRCPLPDYCLLLSARFRELQSLLRDQNVLLVSVTLDPAFDTPEVLARYAERYKADYERWRFLTGSHDDHDVLEQLYRASGINVFRDGAMIDHGLTTLLLDGSGEVARIWRDRDATPEVVVREVELLRESVRGD